MSKQSPLNSTKPFFKALESKDEPGEDVCQCVCVLSFMQDNPSLFNAECFSEVYSTVNQNEQRKDSFLLAFLANSESAALPQALVSVLLLSKATN